MEVKKFYRTQREVASVVNEIIDDYWADKLTDEELEENITMIYENNLDKIIKNNDYTTIIKQQCGKNRLAVVSKITKNR
ncbi:TIGR04540 family protein [Aerococcus urinaeequi]|uniref:TIGR04540 family protein n=1 Tax=Aerococcus urinaeequi TaxID=51665 RepID=UPI003AB0A812